MNVSSLCTCTIRNVRVRWEARAGRGIYAARRMMINHHGCTYIYNTHVQICISLFSVVLSIVDINYTWTVVHVLTYGVPWVPSTYLFIYFGNLSHHGDMNQRIRRLVQFFFIASSRIHGGKMSTCSHLLSRRVDLMEKRCLLVYICHLNKSTLGIGDVDLSRSIFSTSRLNEGQDNRCEEVDIWNS